MRKSITKMEHEDRNSNIINLINLKLIESRAKVEKSKHHDLYCKITNQAINTPSTLGNSKKFYSCQLKKDKPQSRERKMSQHPSPFKPPASSSSTKILTLSEIKSRSRLMPGRGEEQKEVGRSGSRKIFVSIAKSNHSISKQKRNDLDIKEVDSRMLSRDASNLKQKLKICRYKEMARGTHQK